MPLQSPVYAKSQQLRPARFPWRPRALRAGYITPKHMRVGFFTEVYHPVVNGIVASLDGLARACARCDHEVYFFAPRVPGYEETHGPVCRIPSLPLPTSTPYRLTVPVVSRRNRHAILNRLDVLHAHSPFVTGWMGVRYARRLRIPLVYTYHTRLEEYAHYVPFEANATRRAASTLTRNFANLADAVIVPTPAMRERLRNRRNGPGRSDPKRNRSAAFRLRRDEAKRCAIARACARANECCCFVSRLAREKNVELLIDALAECTLPLRLVDRGRRSGTRGARGSRRARGRRARRLTSRRGRARNVTRSVRKRGRVRVPRASRKRKGWCWRKPGGGIAVLAPDAPQLREVLGEAGRLIEPTPRGLRAAMSQVPADARPGPRRQRPARPPRDSESTSRPARSRRSTTRSARRYLDVSG